MEHHSFGGSASSEFGVNSTVSCPTNVLPGEGDGCVDPGRVRHVGHLPLLSTKVAGTGNFGDRFERVFFTDELLVRIHVIIEMIRWTGLAP